jgi:hypothetical protein
VSEPNRDEAEVRAWASLPHTLYEGHDCIRCQVTRLLDARTAALAEREALREALAEVANVAHLAWEDPPTVVKAFQLIERTARAALAETPEAATAPETDEEGETIRTVHYSMGTSAAHDMPECRLNGGKGSHEWCACVCHRAPNVEP